MKVRIAAALVATGAMLAIVSPAHASVTHHQTVASCERAFIRAIGNGHAIRWPWHHDCELLTRGERDHAWNLANRATS